MFTSESSELGEEEGGVGHDEEHGGLQERVGPQVRELHQLPTHTHTHTHKLKCRSI